MSKLYKCTLCNKKKQEHEYYRRNNRLKGISSKCKCCIKILDKERYDKKREEILLQKKSYRLNNLEKIKESQTLYREQNNEFCRERDKKYYYSNLEYNRARKQSTSMKRRSKKLNAIAPWMTKDEESKIRSLYKISKKISKSTGIDHHVDHIIPLVSEYVCGLHTITNLRIIPKIDNLRKGNKLIEDIVYS